MQLVDTPAHKGHQVENSQFRELLGAPLVNGDTVADWEGVERMCNITLPADYKEFVSAYGPGCINDQVYLFHPRAARGITAYASNRYGVRCPTPTENWRKATLIHTGTPYTQKRVGTLRLLGRFPATTSFSSP